MTVFTLRNLIELSYNSLSYAALLFLLASGLSIIFGVMRIVNLAHAAFFLLGGYVALTVYRVLGTALWTLPVAMVVGGSVVAGVAVVIERFFLRRLGQDMTAQVLVTIGFAFIFFDTNILIWTGDNYMLHRPWPLDDSTVIGGIAFPRYRAFMIVAAVVVWAILYFVIERTRAGAIVRATVDDPQMARGIGINTNLVQMSIYGLGVFLSAMGGVVGGAFLGVSPGLDFLILPYAFAVVIIGGLGSLTGAVVGSIVVGFMENFGTALFPELSYFALFAPMAIILAVKPTGLFGRS
ncbi:MAG TPA: branched-chain amino acid ABC transporter permease [Methylomirabilota bacterium]|jgi:branched-chain amino acid transport system permease protein